MAGHRAGTPGGQSPVKTGVWLVGRNFARRALDTDGQPMLEVRCPHKAEGTVHGPKSLLLQYEQDANYHPCDWTICRHGQWYQERMTCQAPIK